MNLTEQQKKGQEVFFRIISEAWENEDFKKLLITKPEETLEKFFGKKLPINKKIKVADQSDPEYLYINIPVKPQNSKAKFEKKTQENSSKENSKSTIMADYEDLYDSLEKKYT